MTAWTPGWDALPEALRRFWAERHLLALTTLRADGSPHVVPVGVTLDEERRCAWVISSRHSRKVQNLTATGGRGRVAACQVDGARWATLEGMATVVDDPEQVARAVEMYAARYRTPRPNPDRVALRIEITRIVHSTRV